MLHFSKFRIFLILGTVLIGLLYALPNVLSGDARKAMPGVFPSSTINLGLDLQGGAHMLLAVDLNDGVNKSLRSEMDGIRSALRKERIRHTIRFEEVDPSVANSEPFLNLVFRSEADAEAGTPILMAQSVNVNDLAIGGGGKTLQIDDAGPLRFKIQISDANKEFLSKRTIEQSMQVLGNRINPTGTLELTIAREGSERILLQVPGAKDVDEIKDRIRRTAKLTFHEHVKGLTDVQLRLCIEDEKKCKPGTRAFPHRDGGAMVVNKREVISGSDLKDSKPGISQETNAPVVNSSFTVRGGTKYCDFTSVHVGDQIVVVLDNQIITAPVIQSPICGGRGQISGGFTTTEARDLAALLNAGALPAKLEIAEERTVGPDLGKDSIRAGQIASFIGLAGVAFFMWISYGLRFGTIANLALTANIILIAGALSLLGATLTLPGIAGIILTIGMAVDANVLIFERIREEASNGRGPVNAIETGYRLSLAPILDANITTFIAAATLYFVGSGPIRGFAVTLAIGIVMSVFTAVVFARLLTSVWLRRTRPKSLPIIKVPTNA